ncbi:YrdC domain-containing protein, mitochondrial [Toxocara canis]|uniref:Threonylcarbamoyl-AMP synthase n=1 Tax=Toxocara canis TaxID=6265 RepID=A0A0B2V418_TOXCA|nr:YrdC domain-containing protein, mitochondrial [Toxocara canis]
MDKIIRLSDSTFEIAISRAVHVLESGGVVALPTDTIYGLSTTLSNADKLFKLKARSRLKPFALFLSDISEISKWAVVTVDKRTIARLLPGPVTLVFNRSTLLPADFNKEHRTIGIRIPDHDFVRAVSRQLGAVPIVQTSANLSGATENPVSIQDFEELWPNVDLIIDGGVLKDPTGEVSRQGSTVVNLCISGTYSIIRDGCVRYSTEAKLRDCGLTAICDGNLSLR